VSYYDDLGVARDATLDDIKSAWRSKAKEHHSDHQGSDEAFRRCRLAYEVLSDPDRRAAYDRTGTIDPTVIADILATVDRELAEARQVGAAVKEGRWWDAAEHTLGMARRGWSRMFKTT
jgi:DnaJ-class molecular chaperone